MPYAAIDMPAMRPRARVQKQNTEATRDSSAIRASVLDAALQLGLGSNNLVADWMFSNPVKEEDEDQIPSPGLTHSEESPTSSPLSSRYPLTPSSSQNHSNGYAQKFNNSHFQQQHANTLPFVLSSESSSLIPHLPSSTAEPTLNSTPPRPTTPSKLKKKRNVGRDGYESDGVVRAEASRKKDKKKGDKDAKDGSHPPASTVPLVPSSGASLLTVLDQESLAPGSIDEPRKRKKSLVKAPPKPKFQFSTPTSSSDQVGYETDGLSKKSKSKGWMSGRKTPVDEDKDLKKAKSLFFRLGNKASKSDLKLEQEREREREKEREKQEEKFMLPIAEKFATTLNLGSSGSSSPSTSTSPPLLPPPAPLRWGKKSEGRLPAVGGSTGLGIDLGLGLSADMFSTSPSTSPSTQTVPPALPTTVPSIPPTTYAFPSHSKPPVSFPPPSNATGTRPDSAGTTTSAGTTGRTSTSTNAHSHSAGVTTNSSAGRTSLATSISTSQSHSQPQSAGVSLVSLKEVVSRESSNEGSPGLVGLPQTPSKRRVLPFLGGGTPKEDSVKKEKEGDKGKKKKEKEREREKAGKKPVISLPITRAVDAGGASDILDAGAPRVPPVMASVSNTPSRPRPTNPPIDGPFGVRGPMSQPPVSHKQFQQQGGLSRQTSSSNLQANTNTLSVAGMNGRMSPTPGRRSPSPLPHTHPNRMTNGNRPGMGMTVVNGNLGVGGGPTSGRHSPLPAPNVLAYYDMPPPSPPPLSPLPNVPLGTTELTVGVAVTTGSPLPSPLLVNSPHSSLTSSPNLGGGRGMGNGTNSAAAAVVPPTSFNPSTMSATTVAGSALRARVQRRLSQQEQKGDLGIAAGVVTSINTANGNLAVPTNFIVQRGRESPFPINPIHSNNLHLKIPSSSLNNSPNGRGVGGGSSPKSGWMDDDSTAAGDDDEGSVEVDESVRGVLARFRESRIEYGKMRMNEREVVEGVIATRKSFEALRGGAGGGDTEAVELAYYEDDGEGSYYPEDEIRDHKSQRRRSTLYLEDEDESGENESSSGHGHGGGKYAKSNRWSGSIYSRASFLDTEKSGQARDRFVKRVEAMLGEQERIPPVPKLPQEFLPGFNAGGGIPVEVREDGEDDDDTFVMKRTVGTGARKVPAGSGKWNRF